jgi:hypothetical protein
MKINRREPEPAVRRWDSARELGGAQGITFGDRRQFAAHAAPAPVNAHSAE